MEPLVDKLLEHLCSVFYRHRWSLKHAFEYFDANNDGVLSPEEFASALEALSSMIDEREQGILDSSEVLGDAVLRLTREQVQQLVTSLDRNSDGVIDYDEFLLALQPRDSTQM